MNQNEKTPKLDLLVRESIQNSLDAAIGKFVSVDFSLGDYTPSALAKYFPELSETLGNASTDYIIISDKGTSGLTGPTRTSETKKGHRGNYISLVKGVMYSNKSSRNPGGAWGIGKFIYYKLGINFVIYYSRIRTEAGFESRMSAVWIDDGSLRFIPGDVGEDKWRGISLWGVLENDEKSGVCEVLPVTDSTSSGKEEIEGILRAFSFDPYRGNETGTAIIVPGFNTDFLVREIRKDDGSKNGWWTSSVPDYLRLAIQRWYFPRMSGANPNVELLPSVNGEPLVELQPFFERMQGLYKATNTHDSGYKLKNIIIREDVGSFEVGTLVWEIVPKSELKTVSAIDNPYNLCGIESDSSEGNHGIVVYTRSLGMIVTYKDPELWSKIPSVGEDAYLIGVFRVNPETKYPHPTEDIETIEDYLRRSETSDHLVWTDIRSYNNTNLESRKILEKTFKNIVRTIKDDLSEAGNEKLKGTRVTTGRKVAETLFPPGGFFVSHTKSTQNTGKKDAGRKGKASSTPTEMRITSIVQAEEDVEVFADIVFHQRSSTVLEVSVSIPGSKKSTMNAGVWKKEIGTEFPFRIDSVAATTVNSHGTVSDCPVVLEGSMHTSKGDRVTLSWREPTRVLISARRDMILSLVVRVSRPVGEVTPVISVNRGVEP